MWALKFPIIVIKLKQTDNKGTIIENFYASCDYERNYYYYYYYCKNGKKYERGGFPYCLISLSSWEKNKAINSHQR